MTTSDNLPVIGPIRTCLGCRKQVAKRELLRVVAGSDVNGSPVVRPDPTGTELGRGAYLHPTSECFDLAVRRKAFGRALRVQSDRGLSTAPVGEFVTSSVDRYPANKESE